MKPKKPVYIELYTYIVNMNARAYGFYQFIILETMLKLNKRCLLFLDKEARAICAHTARQTGVMLPTCSVLGSISLEPASFVS